MLAFIFMQTFDLNIKQRMRIDLNAGTRFDERRKLHLIFLFDSAILRAEFRVVGKFFQINKLVEIVRPLIFQRLIQQCRQRRVALFNPATRRNTISDIVEFRRPQLVIFREQIFDD